VTITRTRLVLGVLWILSLVSVAQWTAQAQGTPPPGVEVRFVRGVGTPQSAGGILVANFGGQWLPITLQSVPDPHYITR
jgi:hypothetical protein